MAFGTIMPLLIHTYKWSALVLKTQRLFIFYIIRLNLVPVLTGNLSDVCVKLYTQWLD